MIVLVCKLFVQAIQTTFINQTSGLYFDCNSNSWNLFLIAGKFIFYMMNVLMVLISISYHTVLSAIWQIFCEFLIFPLFISRAFRRVF